MNITKEANLAAKWILDGKVIAYPTEGVWGIGCNAKNNTAVERVFDLKKRDRSNKFNL